MLFQSNAFLVNFTQNIRHIRHWLSFTNHSLKSSAESTSNHHKSNFIVVTYAYNIRRLKRLWRYDISLQLWKCALVNISAAIWRREFLSIEPKTLSSLSVSYAVICIHSEETGPASCGLRFIYRPASLLTTYDNSHKTFKVQRVYGRRTTCCKCMPW